MTARNRRSKLLLPGVMLLTVTSSFEIAFVHLATSHRTHSIFLPRACKYSIAFQDGLRYDYERLHGGQALREPEELGACLETEGCREQWRQR